MSAYIIASYDISDPTGYEPTSPMSSRCCRNTMLKSSSPATTRRSSKVRPVE